MGAWTELVDYTVPSNTTSVVLNDFGTITKNDFIKVVASINFVAGNDVYLYPNGNTTAGNYYRQRLAGSGSSVFAGRFTNSMFAYGASSTTPTIGYLKLSENNKFNLFVNTNADGGTSVSNFFWYSTSTVDFASGITSLTFTNESANGIGTGSRIQIYRLDAEKVADITTTENATQVDISSLSIDKDSEYLLVSDVLSGSTGGDLFLQVNDTTSGYYSQIIGGNGTSATAGRVSTARFMAQAGNSREITYTHIKLSEIGAYTSQSNELRNVGTSSARIENSFVSSTSEAITSITKLNIVHQTTNAIQSGSTFVLYKLK
jgi:hypothetical protein